MTRFRTLLPIVAALLGGLMLTNAPATAQTVDFAVCANATPESVSDDCMSLMLAFPDPTVSPVALDQYTISNYSFYKVKAAGSAVHDAPGGNVLRTWPQGFHFVRALALSEGWIQIDDGGWMLESDLQYSPASGLTGVRLLDGLNNPFAWALDLMCTSPARNKIARRGGCSSASTA
ncbi:MAG: hypothetical protein MUC99_11605 [Anaerolineae bacterium]|nr:hypothetical protein [Anaerolineae bacterium]